MTPHTQNLHLFYKQVHMTLLTCLRFSSLPDKVPSSFVVLFFLAIIQKVR